MASWFGLLFFACVISGVGVVQTRHVTYALFRESQALGAEQQRLRAESEQLRIQRSALATYIQLDPLARRKLGMHPPSPAEVVSLQPLL